MKICPTCRRTYADDALNFCLEDGSVLTVANEPPPTVMMHQPMQTSANPTFAQPSVQTSWDAKPGYSMQPKKSSKAWMWVVGILGIGLLLCGGGVAGFIFLAAVGDPANNGTNGVNIANTSNGSSNSKASNTSSNSWTRTDDPRTNVEKVDLSAWVQTDEDAVTDFRNDEFFMATRRKRFYYVLVAKQGYQTESAITSVTLRNVDNADSELGYGLVFHSKPVPLQQGYAFLIDTKNQRYRVVRHAPRQELDVVKWTDSSAIRSGMQENTLSVDHKGDNIDLYINGEKVTSIRNIHGFKGGVAGIYSGDAARIAFKNLEIRK